MRLVTLALASFLALLTIMRVAAANSAREEGGLVAADAVGLAVVLLYAFGAMCALGRPALAAVVLALAGVVGVAGGLAVGFGELAVWGACAPVPVATSVAGARRPA